MRRGFTIIEVLVALAIFGYAAIAMCTSYVGVLNAYARAKSVMQSDEDIKFARAALLNQPDYTLATQGAEFDTTDGRHLKWSATIDDQGTEADLFVVTLECEITPADTTQETQKTSETFLVMRPTWSDPSVRTQLKNQAAQRIRDLKAAQTQ